jgi:hypothetical protein
MTHTITRSEEDINRVLGKATQGVNGGNPPYRGQSYEEGILDYHRWLTGDSTDEPLEDVELEEDEDEDDEEDDEDDEEDEEAPDGEEAPVTHHQSAHAVQ